MLLRKTSIREGLEVNPNTQTTALSCYLKNANQTFNSENKEKEAYGEPYRSVKGNQQFVIKGGRLLSIVTSNLI